MALPGRRGNDRGLEVHNVLSKIHKIPEIEVVQIVVDKSLVLGLVSFRGGVTDFISQSWAVADGVWVYLISNVGDHARNDII